VRTLLTLSVILLAGRTATTQW